MSFEREATTVASDGSIDAEHWTAAEHREALDGATLFFRALDRHPLLKPAEELALAKRGERGDAAALEQLFHCNLRLVVYTARRYRGQGVPLLDLIQDGRLSEIP